MTIPTSTDLLEKYIAAIRRQSISHRLHATLFGSKGFPKLKEFLTDLSQDEEQAIEAMTGRIIQLSAPPSLKGIDEQMVYNSPEEFIKEELEEAVRNVDRLRDDISLLGDDFTTIELLKDHLQLMEKYLSWLESEVDKISLMGLQNWYLSLTQLSV